MTPLTPEEVRAELERLKRNPNKLDPEKLAEVNTKTNDLLTLLLKAVAKAAQGLSRPPHRVPTDDGHAADGIANETVYPSGEAGEDRLLRR